MWFRNYRDIENDGWLKGKRPTTGKSGFSGVEMRERCGWGEKNEEVWQSEKRSGSGLLSTLLSWFKRGR